MHQANRTITKYAFKRPESPITIKMRDSFVISENNKSFDTYFQEMKRRNAPESSKFPPNGLAVPSPLLRVDKAKSPSFFN